MHFLFGGVVSEVQHLRGWTTCDVYIWASLQQRTAKPAPGIAWNEIFQLNFDNKLVHNAFKMCVLNLFFNDYNSMKFLHFKILCD